MDKKNLIYEILSPKVNTIVNICGERENVLKHYWYLERCFFYPSYEIRPAEAEFIAKLSFYFGGARVRIEQTKTKIQVIKELKKIYQDIFLGSYYNFERPDLFKVCNEFHDEIEQFFGEDILGCLVGIEVRRFWIFKLKNKDYEIIQKEKVVLKGKTSEYGTIAVDTLSKGDYILKIYFKDKYKLEEFNISNFLTGIKINFF